MANLILSQRLIEQFSLTSLLHSAWRQILFWTSKILVPLATFSAAVIFVLYSTGTGLLASHEAVDVASSDSEAGLLLLKVSVLWLFSLGSHPVVLVFLVLLTSRLVPKRKDNLIVKLAVFLLGAILLVTGQGFHLCALFAPQLMGNGPATFYVAGFSLELMAVVLYALARLDDLFEDRSSNLLEYARDTMGSRNTMRSGDDDDDMMKEGGASRGATPDIGGIVVRKEFEVSVGKAETVGGHSPSTEVEGPGRLGKSDDSRGFGERFVSRAESKKPVPQALW